MTLGEGAGDDGCRAAAAGAATDTSDEGTPRAKSSAKVMSAPPDTATTPRSNSRRPTLDPARDAPDSASAEASCCRAGVTPSTGAAMVAAAEGSRGAAGRSQEGRADRGRSRAYEAVIEISFCAD